MLIGRYENSIDAKGRIIIPSKFRKELEDSCVLFKAFEGCLYIFPAKAWDDFLKNHVINRPEEDEEAADFQLLVYDHARPCDIDSQGRVNIPSDFASHAGFVKDIITLGHGDRLHIWAAEAYEEKMEGLSGRGRELFSKMGRYVLGAGKE